MIPWNYDSWVGLQGFPRIKTPCKGPLGVLQGKSLTLGSGFNTLCLADISAISVSKRTFWANFPPFAKTQSKPSGLSRLLKGGGRWNNSGYGSFPSSRKSRTIWCMVRMACNFKFRIKCPRHGENVLSPQNAPRLETFPSCYFFSLAVKVVESCIYCTLTSELSHVDSPKELSLGFGLGVFITLACSLGLLFILTLLLSPSFWDWASRLMPLSTYHTHSRLWSVISSSICRLPFDSGGLTFVFLPGLSARPNTYWLLSRDEGTKGPHVSCFFSRSFKHKMPLKLDKITN